MPAVTEAGDFFVLAMTSFGGTAASADPRLQGGQSLEDGDPSRHSAVYWGTAEGSGTALSIDLTGSASRVAATLVVYEGSGAVVSQQIVGPSTGAAPVVLGADVAIAAMVGVGGQIEDSGGAYTPDGGAGNGLYFSRIFHRVGDAPETSFTFTYAGMVLGVNGA